MRILDCGASLRRACTRFWLATLITPILACSDPAEPSSEGQASNGGTTQREVTDTTSAGGDEAPHTSSTSRVESRGGASNDSGIGGATNRRSSSSAALTVGGSGMGGESETSRTTATASGGRRVESSGMGGATNGIGGRGSAGMNAKGGRSSSADRNAGGSITAGGTRASASSTPLGGMSSSAGTKAAGGTVASGGTKASGGASSSTTSSGDCPYVGHVTYTLAKASAPTADQQAAYTKITAAMDTAVKYYNCYTEITKTINVSYVPSVQTADGNINGSIRFGSTASMNHVTAMHEISHTVGIGTASKWSSMVSNGQFTGTSAKAEVTALFSDSGGVVHADTQHFWPGGLNYESEGKNESDLIAHCRMVVAIRKDLGLN